VAVELLEAVQVTSFGLVGALMSMMEAVPVGESPLLATTA
jgi:hypothetical protein